MPTMCQAGTVLVSEIAICHIPSALLTNILYQLLLVVIIKAKIRIANIC